MAIRVVCLHCFTKLKAPDELAGQNMTCPKCGGQFAVPSRKATTVEPEEEVPARGVEWPEVLGRVAMTIGSLVLAGIYIFSLAASLQPLYPPGPVAAALAISGFGGLVVGAAKDRPLEGLLWGILLGPTGLMIIYIRPRYYSRRCPECLGGVPKKARRCRHCGELLKDEA